MHFALLVKVPGVDAASPPEVVLAAVFSHIAPFVVDEKARKEGYFDGARLGGRAGGVLSIFPGRFGLIGHEFQVFATKPENHRLLEVDCARYGDIDFDRMRRRAYDHALVTWDRVHGSIEDWVRPSEGRVEWTPELTTKFRNLMLYGDWKPVEGDTREAYATRLRDTASFATVAVVDEVGEWHQAEKDFDRAWGTQFFNRFYAPTAPDTIVAILDCHA